MADNFVRKTVSKTCKLPNIRFFDVGDFFLCNNGVYVCVPYQNTKAWSQLPGTGVVTALQQKVSALEKTVADHETRIKALESPAN